MFAPPLTRVAVGSLALRSLYAAFDLGAGRVGFANKPRESGAGDAAASQRQCAARKACVGLETWYGPRNRCLPPPCKKYYFQEINPTTHECQWSLGFQITAFTALLLVMAGQISTNHFYWEADRQLRAKLEELEGSRLKED